MCGDLMRSIRLAGRLDGDRHGLGEGGFDLVADRNQLELLRVVDAEVHHSRRAAQSHNLGGRIEGNDVRTLIVEDASRFAAIWSARNSEYSL